MNPLRYVLLAGSVAGAVFAGALLRHAGDGWGDDHWVAFALGAFFVVNFIFLLAVDPPSGGRIGRMISLWMAAKERDLQSRATPADSRRSEASDAAR